MRSGGLAFDVEDQDVVGHGVDDRVDGHVGRVREVGVPGGDALERHHEPVAVPVVESFGVSVRSPRLVDDPRDLGGEGGQGVCELALRGGVDGGLRLEEHDVDEHRGGPSSGHGRTDA